MRYPAAVLAVIAWACLAAAPAGAAEPPWPPARGSGVLFVHYGEEHWDDDDGLRLLPKVIADSARYAPNLVTLSADKSSDGTVENLSKWLELMGAYDRAGVPFFAAVGNHDRDNAIGGLPPAGPLTNYQQVFAGRPYPFGDMAPPKDPLFSPSARPADDPAGASSHYWLDYANVRWIFLDNSCYGFDTPGANCDSMQNPPFPDQGATGTYDFLKKRADEATARGKLVFVVMHMPTQDPRPGHTEPTPGPHTMGEGIAPYSNENARFEQEAEQAGVDAVFTAHVKGQWIYTARKVPYHIDGGAGGELYVNPGGEVGTDTGYWHGYRLIRVGQDGKIATDTVPIFVPGGIAVEGPATVARGQAALFTATGRQPTEEGPRVDALELRDPDRSAANGENLPTPARIWTSANPLVLAPVAAAQDDSRRDAKSQTVSGAFRAGCPGKTEVQVISGWEQKAAKVTVPSAAGPIVRQVRRRAGRVRAGRRAAVATVRLAQPAEVLARVARGKRTVRELIHRCRGTKPLVVRWDGRGAAGKRLAGGAYTVEVVVRSDRAPVLRRFGVRLG